MSLFVSLTIPRKTSQDNPTIENIPVYPGIIRKVQILHPTGCVDLVGVWIEYLSAKIFPSNADGYFTGNGYPIIFQPDFLLDKSPFVLGLKGYNLDDFYQHTITFLIEIEAVGSFGHSENRPVGISSMSIITPEESVDNNVQ